MKRGFLNTRRYNKAIEEAYAPAVPAEQEPAPFVRPGGRKANIGERASAVQDAMSDVEQTYIDRQVPLGVTQSSVSQSKLASMSGEGENRVEAPYGSPPVSNDAKGKEKEKAASDELPTLPDNDFSVALLPNRRPAPRPLGWGRDPREEFFHTMPKAHGRKKRAVFLFWRRHKTGKPILSSDKRMGKLSFDGYPWGETLYDFFYVNRVPGHPDTEHSSVSTVTGSIIYEIMKAMGELHVALDEIEWVKTEGVPRVEGAADTGELIRRIDTRLHLMGLSKLDAQNTKGGLKGNGDGGRDEKDIAVDLGSDSVGNANMIPNSTPPPTTTLPFHSSHYPEPWPSTPFENPHSILLQERIPLHLLPKTLFVHDPFSLLSARRQTFENTDWNSRRDVIRTYNLHVSNTGSMRSLTEEARRQRAEELEEFKARTLILLRYNRTKEQIKNHEPVIEVPLPPYSRRLTTVEEGHLYLSPVAKAGEGHHSIVYKGEWELPRDIFVKKSICRTCFEGIAKEELQRLKDTGRYQKMLDAGSWGPNGYTGRAQTRAELDAINDPSNLGSDGEIIERELTCVISPELGPSQVVEILEENNIWDMLMKKRESNRALFQFIKVGEEEEEAEEDAPILRINPPFSSQKPCTHEAQYPVPRTAKFTVVAKLSTGKDDHLMTEALNYQMFPEHFFDHYNGYVVVSQLHTIVPIHAIVPQFYGYYLPKEPWSIDRQRQGTSYLSPILLLEHCGQPIDPNELSDEDQEECVSMLLRFQRSGWLHRSVAQRNFVVQYGKPTEFPSVREMNPEPSFRLIDFGRSKKWETTAEKRKEEMDAINMFENLAMRCQMGVTFDH